MCKTCKLHKKKVPKIPVVIIEHGREYFLVDSHPGRLGLQLHYSSDPGYFATHGVCEIIKNYSFESQHKKIVNSILSSGYYS